MSRFILSVTAFLLLFFLSSHYITPTSAREYQTKNVFLVVIDGVRNDEAFDDETHQYIPHLWNDLRPMGTIYSNFFSTTVTYTTAGHETMISGVRCNYPNAEVEPCEPYRPRFPTVFEYYRKSDNIPQFKTWAILGKENLSSLDYSLYPGYGPSYKCSVIFNIGADTVSANQLHDTMDRDHPSLVLLNLRDVDVRGHIGDWEKYVAAISLADSLVWDLWVRIQDDSLYRDRTTMLITTDHGRHDDMHGGFSDHGGTDHGVEHLMFLAMGPDIKQDTVITDRRDLVDIAPTIGELLGFETPFAEGTVMSEMINPPAGHGRNKEICEGHIPTDGLETRITDTNSMSISPDLAKTSSYIHLIWTESDSSSISEKKRLMYSRRDMIFEDWSGAIPLFDDIDGSAIMIEGMIKPAGGEDVAVAARCLFEKEDSAGEPVYEWQPVVTRSQAGEFHMPTVIIDDFADGSRSIIPSRPSAYVSESEIDIAWITRYRWFEIKRSIDGGGSFFSILDYSPQTTENLLYFAAPSITGNEGGIIVLTECNFFHFSKLLFGNLNAVFGDPSGVGIFDEGKEPSYYPRVASSPDRLHFTWADLASGSWQILYRRALPDGSQPSEIVNLSESPEGAFTPALYAEGDSLVVVWEDLRDGEPEIYGTLSVDGGVHWSAPGRLTYTAGRSIRPSVLLNQDTMLLSWQDDTDGNWEIYYLEIPLTSVFTDL